MHISEGVLSGPVLISGAALAAVGTGIGLKKLDYDQIAKAGMLAAAFFVASLIHVPIGPSNKRYGGHFAGLGGVSGHFGCPGTAERVFSVRRNYNPRR